MIDEAYELLLLRNETDDSLDEIVAFWEDMLDEEALPAAA